MIPGPERTYMRADDAAEYLTVAKSTLANMRVQGRGPRFARFGTRIVYRRIDLDAWMEAQIRQSTSEQEPAI